MNNILKKIEYGSTGHPIILKAVESELLFTYIKQLIKNEIVLDELEKWIYQFIEEHKNSTGIFDKFLTTNDVLNIIQKRIMK